MSWFYRGRHRRSRFSITVPELVAQAHDRGELSLTDVFALPFEVWERARVMTTAWAFHGMGVDPVSASGLVGQGKTFMWEAS